eukprot:5173438-Alexandrium_andersonii.AAC.1
MLRLVRNQARSLGSVNLRHAARSTSVSAGTAGPGRKSNALMSVASEDNSSTMAVCPPDTA